MKDFVKTYEIWIFLILSPIINTLVVYANIEGLISGALYTHGRFYVMLLLLMGIVKYTRGVEGIKDMFRPMTNWKVHPKWYLFGFLFALLIATVTLIVKSLYLDVEFSSLYKFNIPGIYNVFVIMLWAFVGEVVWVSYSVRELSKKMKPFPASQIVGFFWTLWWIPVVYLNISVIANLPIWALFLNVLGAAGMCTIIYAYSKSGICVWILQFMMNLSLILLPVSPALSDEPTYGVYSVLYFLTMLGFMYFMNPIKKMRSVEST
ncbi:MAG: hypothetical protein ACSHXF_10915 [Aquaticitalea sp.]